MINCRIPNAYAPIAVASTWAVLSLDSISPSPIINNLMELHNSWLTVDGANKFQKMQHYLAIYGAECILSTYQKNCNRININKYIFYDMNSSFSPSVLNGTNLQRSCSFYNIFFTQHHNYFYQRLSSVLLQQQLVSSLGFYLIVSLCWLQKLRGTLWIVFLLA